jgi:hypothetical protein
MTSNNNKILKRKRERSFEGSGLFYDGKDITSLLLGDPDHLSPADRILVTECYSHFGRDLFEKLALDNKIVPFVAHVFMALECDKDFWKVKHEFFVKRNLKIKSLLDAIFDEMKEFSCESLTLTENFAVVLAAESCIGCFCSGDVDLSADLAERDAIIGLLNKFAFTSKDQPQVMGEYSGQSMQFFNPEAIDVGFWVNVIWKPVTRAFLVQDKYDVRLARDRLLAASTAGSSIRILDDTSLLYFCALHISAGHYFTMNPGLRLYVDIDRIARSPNIDWDCIIAWEHEDDAGIRISVALYLCQRLFNTPIPDRVYSDMLNSRRNQRFLKYLYNSEINQIQGNSGIFRRLYVELVSDNKNIVTNFISRVFQVIRLKISIYKL